MGKGRDAEEALRVMRHMCQVVEKVLGQRSGRVAGRDWDMMQMKAHRTKEEDDEDTEEIRDTDDSDDSEEIHEHIRAEESMKQEEEEDTESRAPEGEEGKDKDKDKEERERTKEGLTTNFDKDDR